MSKTMKQILELGQHVDKFHPDAVKRYQEFLDDFQDIDLNAIEESDVKAFLSKSEFEDYQHSLKRLSEWLEECKLTNDSGPYHSYLYDFPVWGVLGFKDLLLKVYWRKRIQKREREMKAEADMQSYMDFCRRERERELAKVEHKDFVDKLTSSLDKFKTSLAKSKEPQFNDYPDWLKSYHPGNWCTLSFPPDGWMTPMTTIKIAAQKALLIEALRAHVDYNLVYGGWFIPKVKYELIVPPLSPHIKGHPAKPGAGIPCLRWQMVTYILSTAEFHLDDGTISDVRYGYNFQGRCDSEKLGTFYSGPELWRIQDAFVTPLSLLLKFGQGKAELSGVEVLKMDAPWTTYRISGFADEVTLHDDFIKFIRDMAKKSSLDKALLSRKMCDSETALLIKQKMDKLKELEAPTVGPQKAVGQGIETGDDFSDMVTALQGLGYPKIEAMPAAKHICGKFPDKTMGEKIKLALQYLSQ